MTTLAFHVWDDEAPSSEEASHEIVFAETPYKAKYVSDAYQMSDDDTGIKVKRVPEFDQYAQQGKVPMEVMVEHGWMYECELCFSYADESGLIVNDEIYCEDCQEKIYVEDGKVYIKDDGN